MNESRESAQGGLDGSVAAAKPGRTRWSWRTVDIVVVSVLGAAFGVLFAVWNNLVYPTVAGPLQNSPFAPLVSGVWLLPAVVGALVVRRPGAAVCTEIMASVVSMFAGSAWGLTVFLSGLWQGLGAEIVFAALFYRRWGVVPAVLAGGAAGLAMGLYESTTSSIAPYAWDWKVVYILSAVATGLVVAGVFGYLLVRALARTGVLAPFASGRIQDEI